MDVNFFTSFQNKLQAAVFARWVLIKLNLN